MSSFLRWAAIIVLVSHVLIVPAYGEWTVHYRTYLPRTNEEFNRFTYTIQKNLSGGYQVHGVIEEGEMITNEDYTLDENFATTRFRIVNVKETTDYIGQRKENSIIVRGQFKGEPVKKTMTIDQRPFYYNPKLGLTSFVRSGEKKRTFWGFQNRELGVYPMVATREGLDTISVHGKKIQAMKVYWTVDDFRSMFFKRIYWFRQSDGLYLKQKSDGGKFRELVSEEGGL